MCDDDYDPDFEEDYHRDQRKLYSGPMLYDCLDCGQKECITDEMRRRGYHCDRCTRAIEEGF